MNVRPFTLQEESEAAIHVGAEAFMSMVKTNMPEMASGDISALVSAIQAVIKVVVDNDDSGRTFEKIFPAIGSAIGIMIGANVHPKDRDIALIWLGNGITDGIRAVTKIHDTQGNA